MRPRQLWFREHFVGTLSRPVDLEISVHAADMDALLGGRTPCVAVTGRYHGDILGAEHIAIEAGTLTILVEGGRRLLALRHMFVVRGRRHTFTGKTPADGKAGLDVAVLEVMITDDAGQTVANGVLRSPLERLPRMIGSVEIAGADDVPAAKLEFLRFYLREELHPLLGERPPRDPVTGRRRALAAKTAIGARYDAVVIGSGYGGGAAAAALARARDADGRPRRIALLERGREWRAGEFPDHPLEFIDALRHRLNPTGLFEFHRCGDIDVLVGNGLGGTSLINANVMVEPDPRVFKRAPWPTALPELDPYFRRARAVICPEVDPRPPRKSKVFLDAVTASGESTSAGLAELAVSFVRRERDDTGNLHDACVRCGGCVIGCNHSAKGSVDMNYVSIAERQGCEVFTELEVRTITRGAEGTVIVRGHDLRSDQEFMVEAEQVVLAAGVIGSFSILARSRDAGLAVSDALGSRFGGNGDILGLGYNTDKPSDASEGPTITSFAAFRGDDDPCRHFLLEEGGLPRAFTPFVRRMLPLLRRKDTDHGLLDKLREVFRVILDLFGGRSRGAFDHSLIYFGMGFEEHLGQMRLDGTRVHIDWSGAAALPFAGRIDDGMTRLTRALGGVHVRHPNPQSRLREDLITAHPLGGCPMGDDAVTSVVDRHGALHGHAGRIFVADGSIVPAPLGVNPALTIAALGEYIGEQIARGWVQPQPVG